MKLKFKKKKWFKYLWVLVGYTFIIAHVNSLRDCFGVLLNCTNLHCLPCCSAAGHYVEQNKSQFTFNFVFLHFSFISKSCPNKTRVFRENDVNCQHSH